MAEQDTTRDIVMHMEGKLDATLKMVQAHDCDLNGNGKPGLKSDVRSIKEDVEEIKKIHEKKDDRTWQIKALFIGEGVTLLGLTASILLHLK